ncbi:RcnB family protein [Novosphingobium naphthalenivorans]|uniref:RcnB family protein n=1 Tax=Novosphingobium naphthalenivorans TaxID=273168 RepID=UPI0008349A99|nr:RcnB family protein [Novosphingobium naphthalenivorans]
MSYRHLVSTPLAVLLAMSMPSYAQAQGAGGPGQPPRQQTAPQSSKDRAQRQPASSQTQRARTSPSRETQSADRRNSPDIKVYRGQDSYRPGKQPPLVQRNHDAQRNRELYRQAYRAQERYRIRPYVRPRGWYLNDWVIGEILPSLFWTRNYWLADYWRYSLPIPPAGCIWVRYNHDALLIDQRTGEVIGVIYDIFY